MKNEIPVLVGIFAMVGVMTLGFTFGGPIGMGIAGGGLLVAILWASN